ncbi:hypothetical protein V1514DRAFT_321377 [Lipomyces japonicus]|uniref:uncharacterized protein n=1 Tax=Lipomyces japonicus TaxID=56871 RepID=UPI0034CDC39A
MDFWGSVTLGTTTRPDGDFVVASLLTRISNHNLTQAIISDNGPPFDSTVFNSLAINLDIVQRLTPTHNPGVHRALHKEVESYGAHPSPRPASSTLHRV